MRESAAPESANVDGVHCEHGDRCGGCSMLGVPEPEQLRQKRTHVGAAFARYPVFGELTVQPVVPARPVVGYRTRAKLIVARDGAVGLYARGTHEVIDIPACRVLAPELASVVAELRALARAQPGVLSGIDVREARAAGVTRVLVTLLGEAQALPRLEALAREVATLEHVAGVAVSERAADAPAFFGAGPRHVAGEAAVRDQLLEAGPYHLATHGSFIQAHRGQAAAIAERVLAQLTRTLGDLRGTRVLELYAGAGALGLCLRQRGAQPTLVERFAPALELAARAGEEQALSGIVTFGDDAAHAVEQLRAERARFDAVVVNPPRSGLASKLRAGIAALRPRAIAYVSCEPQTLARDLSHLALLGYAAQALEPYDLMPLTDAIETFTLLTPAAAPAISVLYEDELSLVVDKPPHLPTTPQGTPGGSLLELVRKQRGLEQLAAVHRLDAGTSGVCLLSKRGSATAALSARLKSGEKQYLALARGIARDKGSVRRPLRDGSALREARTRYTRLEVVAGHSFVRVRPDEGRTHQIRRHLAAIGHPVLGDTRHGDAASNRYLEQKYGLDRSFLHLARLELGSERGAPARVFEAPLPGDLRTVLEAMRGDGAR